MRGLDHGLGWDHHRAAGPDMLRSAGREVCGVRQRLPGLCVELSAVGGKLGVLASLPRGLTT